MRFTLAALLLLFSSIPIAAAISEETEKATVIWVDVQGDIVDLGIPDEVHLGQVARGFETENVEVQLSNNGNTDLKIAPVVFTGAPVIPSVFDNIFFSESGDDGTFEARGRFSMVIPKPDKLGESREKSFYIKMDLRDYTGFVAPGTNTLHAGLRFIITQA